MKIILDYFFDEGLKEYLSSQTGIVEVKVINNKDSLSEFYIATTDEITPMMVLKYVELYQNEQMPVMMGFDKSMSEKTKDLKYVVDDLCCEYCYKWFVTKLFENNNIKSVTSNFDFNIPVTNIEFYITYSEECEEREIINYIKENLQITH